MVDQPFSGSHLLVEQGKRPMDNASMDFLVSLATSLLVLGLYLDGWAHNNLPSALETFFTPWHAVLYSGFLLTAGVHVYYLGHYRAQGYSWRLAMPRGYGPSLLGIVLFLAGGIGDMLWHEIFGIEEDVEALLSPTHLLLATGGVLFVTGPLRAAWGKASGRTASWTEHLPSFLSLFFLLSALTFFTQYAHFMGHPHLMVRGAGFNNYLFDVTGIANMLVPLGLTVGLLLVTLRRWNLPPGVLILLVFGNGLLTWIMNFERASPYPEPLLSLLLASILGEIYLQRLQPSPERPNALRLFAFALPLTIALLYFGTLLLTDGLFWSVHMWAGVTFSAGILGLLLSYLAVPPAIPDSSTNR